MRRRKGQDTLTAAMAQGTIQVEDLITLSVHQAVESPSHRCCPDPDPFRHDRPSHHLLLAGMIVAMSTRK
ncbi:MAG: hypothetical protein R3F37_13535 [Candidatus Competibacteraceae bacterium]